MVLAADPLSKIAARKRACGSKFSGTVICRPSEVAPADWPTTVTLRGSPPNAAMFSCIHTKACRWSLRPRLSAFNVAACVLPTLR